MYFQRQIKFLMPWILWHFIVLIINIKFLIKAGSFGTPEFITYLFIFSLGIIIFMLVTILSLYEYLKRNLANGNNNHNYLKNTSMDGIEVEALVIA